MNVTNNIHHIRNLYANPGLSGNTAEPNGESPASRANLPEDRVSFSKEALAQNGDRHSGRPTPITSDEEMDTEEQQAVNDLRRRDAEVKAHEAAHMAAGSGIVQGGASYQYQSGPDGKMYAVGGEVQIDVSAESTPEATIQKMQQVKAAALAPAQPSGTDRAVAAQAAQVEAQARMEKMQENQEKQEDQGTASALAYPTDPEHAKNAHTPPGSQIDFMA